ncbi:adenosylcobinamide-GDP ribazoletransferase [Pseudodesulfovibrio tunisiensis]|uniref:adenosylcobinamide-GDP ribazoletransferase n=1 Tax=Pseudodesulfovibrio tunisiensis TaxID=463192 RepID=UPI001FB2F0B4|nr:adenosylcobinamide-GDP ribazoletransferase [Pseudodesulfovibrio tunisiensis]
MNPFRSYVNALSFMTRLVPARTIPDEDFRRGMACMPFVGLTLGLVLVVPIALGLFRSHTWVQAWLLMLGNVYLTRGLHMDGLSDVFDGVTAHTSPERFWSVVKDSRSGAFGVLSMVMASLGLVVLYHSLLDVGAYWAIAWAFVAGRTACVGLGYMARHLARPGLGKLHMDGATLSVALISGLITLVLGAFMAGPLGALAGMFLSAVAVVPLYRLAERVEGVNGDFLGCAIVLGECCACLGCLLFV